MKLTVILPTFNNEETLGECLESIYSQNTASQDYEVLLIDGGSSDKTLSIAGKYPVEIIENPKKVEEAARLLGIDRAKGEILAFIDADNILVGSDWINQMLKPFHDQSISFADTLFFSYRKNDPVGVRYQALIGGDDPIAMYLGLYNRWNYATGKWTDYPHENFDRGEYLECKLLDVNKVPPMGSNGFLVRTDLAREFVSDTFVHSDFVYEIVRNGYNKFAKVKVGLIHNQLKFFPNKIRRLERRSERTVSIKYNYGLDRFDILLALLRIILVIPVIYHVIRGFFTKPDTAWFFHPVATYYLLLIHLWFAMKKIVK